MADKNCKKCTRISNSDLPEFVGQIIDIFEDFLDSRGVIIDNPERDEDPNADPGSMANIYGTDYGELQDEIEQMLVNWGLANPRNNNNTHTNDN